MKKFRFSMILVLTLVLILSACATPAVQTPPEEPSG
jgi:predicted small secreted protein